MVVSEEGFFAVGAQGSRANNIGPAPRNPGHQPGREHTETVSRVLVYLREKVFLLYRLGGPLVLNGAGSRLAALNSILPVSFSDVAALGEDVENFQIIFPDDELRGEIQCASHPALQWFVRLRHTSVRLTVLPPKTVEIMFLVQETGDLVSAEGLLKGVMVLGEPKILERVLGEVR